MDPHSKCHQEESFCCPIQLRKGKEMTLLAVYDIGNQKVSDINLDDRIFDAKINPTLFYDVVRMDLASQRKGTASTKNKALVRGGGAKPWRQKGTGRARAGSRRSPLWRGGGTIFGPMPRDYSFSLPKKVKSGSQLKASGGEADSFGRFFT